MAWELLAIWAIVLATLTWFVRDERRLKAERELAEAAGYYAHASKYRHVAARPTPPPRPPLRRGGLSAEQRAILQSLADGRRQFDHAARRD